MASQVRERFVRASNWNFSVLEMGEGPLVLCLHGFPDTAHSFRYQMPALAAAGYHAVAPFMRGYSPTEAAPDGRYDSAALSEDALALIAALGYKDAILFGHDWGAVAAYGAAVASPERISKIVTAAVPYGTKFFEALIINYAQQRRSWYMFFFQTAIAETALAHNDFAFLEKLWADWSPGWRWAPEDMEALKKCFRAKGTLDAALGYYRATLGPAFKTPADPKGIAAAMTGPSNGAGVMITGLDDGCIGAELLEGMSALFPKGLKIERVAGGGPFFHHAKPELVNEVVVRFLRS